MSGIGAALAAIAPGALLQTLFALLLLVLAPLLATGPSLRKASSQRSTPLALVLAGITIGTLSASVGLGGALLTIPVLVLLMGFPERRALAASTSMMTLTAASATLGFIWHGWGVTGLPAASLGYVSLVIGGAIAIAVTALPAAMLGARFAHRANRWVGWNSREPAATPVSVDGLSHPGGILQDRHATFPSCLCPHWVGRNGGLIRVRNGQEARHHGCGAPGFALDLLDIRHDSSMGRIANEVRLYHRRF